MTYYVIYDGNCNLCTNLVQILETIDRGELFQYAPMQAEETLKRWDITPNNCELGMIVIDANDPKKRWQGSAAAEKIGELLPLGGVFVAAYRLLPGLKWTGDRLYEQIRDNRYSWFGKRDTTYNSAYNIDCGCNPGKKL
ncbi:thiol-disulfide oxidoreductase DCC family protein [Synechocystis sp. PCC 7509]|uniref:thiol-disulfide oxidoreductase DCC family protein n=1 Tax=Synechocystis sp. PCC 7509 TaxID=927677 RepID=UPI0002AC4623|nr:DCC1-like thiol-disulfide oxidoreductase family protein [Synechocystis sp. PCC 7509]